MAELNDTQVIENSVETKQSPLTEQSEGKKSVMLSVVKGNYARKSAKCNRKIEKLQDSILILTTDKCFLESKISELENKINIENAAVTALCNSNNFLESVKGQSFRIDSVLIFLTFNNNRKMIDKGRKTERLKTEINRIKSQISLIDKEIDAVKQKIEGYESEVNRYDLKQQNITAIEKLNIANPVVSFFLAKNSEEAAADISKYCYKEVSEEELSKLESFDYSRRRSKINDKRIIIRFEKVYKEQFEKALA